MSLRSRNGAYATSQLRGNLADLRGYTPGPRTSFDLSSVPVIIDSSTSIAGEYYRWEYTVKVAVLEYESMDFSSSTDLDLKAYNGWEAGNTANSVAALAGGDPADLQTGFTVDPVPDGVIVLARAQIFSDPDFGGDNDGAYYLFSTPNPIGGACQ